MGCSGGSSTNEKKRVCKFLTLLALFWNGSYAPRGHAQDLYLHKKDHERTDGYNKEITHFRKPVGLLSAAWFGKEEIRVFTGSPEIIGYFFPFSKTIQQ